MNQILKHLVQLQELDSQILEKQLFVDKFPVRIQEIDAPLRDASAELDSILRKKESALRAKKEKEAGLEDINEKIKKMKSRINDIKTNKEYQAHLTEIENLGKKISDIEEEILVIMEDLENLGKKEQVEKEKVAVQNREIAAVKKELSDDKDKYEKELSFLRDQRYEVTRLIEPETYNLYMSALSKGNGLALCRAENEICFGCNMNIPPQLFVEVRKNEEINQCLQCQRILYMLEK